MDNAYDPRDETSPEPEPEPEPGPAPAPDPAPPLEAMPEVDSLSAPGPVEGGPESKPQRKRKPKAEAPAEENPDLVSYRRIMQQGLIVEQAATELVHAKNAHKRAKDAHEEEEQILRTMISGPDANSDRPLIDAVGTTSTTEPYPGRPAPNADASANPDDSANPYDTDDDPNDIPHPRAAEIAASALPDSEVSSSALAAPSLRPTPPTGDTAWRRGLVSFLKVADRTISALHNSNVTTIGQLYDLADKGLSFDDIAGINGKASDKINAALSDYFASHLPESEVNP